METKIHPCEEGGLAGWDWTKRVLFSPIILHLRPKKGTKHGVQGKGTAPGGEGMSCEIGLARRLAQQGGMDHFKLYVLAIRFMNGTAHINRVQNLCKPRLRQESNTTET